MSFSKEEGGIPKRSVRSYGVIAKFLHWGFAVLYVYGIVKQVDSLTRLEDAAFLRFEVVFALIFLIFLCLRYFYMKVTLPTALPEETPKYTKIFVRTAHLAMYFSMAMIAISGLMIGGLFWLGFKDGVLISFAIGIHDFSVLSSYWLVGFHVAAALYHRFKGDGIWNAMVPFWKENKT